MGNTDQIDFAYDLYIHSADRQKPRSKKNNNKGPSELCKRFKENLSRQDVTVHFVGSWDTVSSVGIIKRPSLPETTNGMTHVCAFRHALALDERRVKFLPEYAYGGSGLPLKSQDFESRRTKGDVKEVWFAGSHSEIGGGKTAALKVDHFGPSLRWMLHEATQKGLKIKHNEDPWDCLIPKPSMHFFYRVMEYLPILRLSYTGRHNITRWPPHLRAPRKIQDGQLVHESVFDPSLKESGYHPTATFFDNRGFKEKDIRARKVLEKDLYFKAIDVLQELNKSYEDLDPKANKRQQYDKLRVLCSSPFGKQYITGYSDSKRILTDALEKECRNPEVKLKAGHHDNIVTLINALDSFDPVSTSPSALIIGIDTYLTDDPAQAVEPHRNCIEGVSVIASLLMETNTKLPYDKIRILLNERATRNNIVESIWSLVTNDQFTANDPIFIFFAGRSVASKGNSFALLPYDCHIYSLSKRSAEMEYSNSDTNRYSFGDQGTPVNYITAGVIDEILSEIPPEKRKKIIFILDCPDAEQFRGNFQSAGLSSQAFISAFRNQEKKQHASSSSSVSSFSKTLTGVVDELNRRNIGIESKPEACCGYCEKHWCCHYTGQSRTKFFGY